MAALSFFDRFLQRNCAFVHGHSRKALSACVGSVMNGASVTGSLIGRGLAGESRTKSKIKRVDRLLGNKAVHRHVPLVYAVMARCVLGARLRPVILVDWSSFERGNQWALLRASVAVDGRSLTILEHVHPIAELNTPAAHERFLDTLARIVPAHAHPIIVTDAGFLGPWFNAVRQRGWDFIGRLRGLTQIKLDGTDKWLTVKHFYNKASRRARTLGLALCAKTSPYPATVHLVDETARANRTRSGHRHTYNEPWLLVTSLAAEQYRARQCVNLYAKRMQIELTFRDLKDTRWSMALVNSRARSGPRREMLLLIATLATFMLWLIGLAAETVQWHRHFQANTVKKKRVLSFVFLGREVYRNPNYSLDEAMLDKAYELMKLLLVDPTKELRRS